MTTPGRLGIGIIGMGHVGPVIGSALRAVGHQIVAVSASSDTSRERADAMLPGVPIATPEEVVRRSEVVVVAVPFAVTAAAPFLPIAQALVVEMGGEPVVVAEEDRPLYHAGLAHGANFIAGIAVQTTRILAEAGIENPALYVRPLLEAALDRALTEGVAGISGPAARADAGTIAAHARCLASREELAGERDTYEDMTRALIRLLRDARLLDERSATCVEGALLEPGT